MKNPDCHLLLQPEPESGAACPSQRSCDSRTRAGPDSEYVQARRQGIYLAACIVDEVAALGVKSPQAAIDEIRRRICELVRHELNESALSGSGRRR